MPVNLLEQDGGRVLEVHASGKLTNDDYAHFVPEIERLIRQHGKLRILFEMSGFHGWEAKALWDDIKFDLKHFRDIERLAIVGDKRWQKWMASFCKPFTTAAIRYFDRAESSKAGEWLKMDERQARAA